MSSSLPSPQHRPLAKAFATNTSLLAFGFVLTHFAWPLFQNAPTGPKPAPGTTRAEPVVPTAHAALPLPDLPQALTWRGLEGVGVAECVAEYLRLPPPDRDILLGDPSSVNAPLVALLQVVSPGDSDRIVQGEVIGLVAWLEWAKTWKKEMLRDPANATRMLSEKLDSLDYVSRALLYKSILSAIHPHDYSILVRALTSFPGLLSKFTHPGIIISDIAGHSSVVSPQEYADYINSIQAPFFKAMAARRFVFQQLDVITDSATAAQYIGWLASQRDRSMALEKWHQLRPTEATKNAQMFLELFGDPEARSRAEKLLSGPSD